MSRCDNCGREFPGGYPLHCGCGHITGKTVADQFRLSAAGENLWVRWHSRLAAAIKRGEWDADEQRQWHREEFVKNIPRTACDCSKKYAKLCAANPIDWSTAETAFASSVLHHSLVNQSIEIPKPGLSLNAARVLYLQEQSQTPRALVTIATGHKYRQILAESRPSLVRYAEKCQADYFELTDARHSDWRVEKFRVHSIATCYDQTLFVDADCWIRDSCPDLFALYPRGAALHNDWEFLHEFTWYHRARLRLFESQGFTPTEDPKLALNSGVVLCDRATADLWKPPLKPFPRDHVAEQILVETQAMRGELHFMPSEFNCQWWFKAFTRLQPSAHIVHFADSPTKLISLRELRESS
jgi:hypothetical protein